MSNDQRLDLLGEHEPGAARLPLRPFTLPAARVVARPHVERPIDIQPDGNDVVADNVNALGAIYFAAQLEDLKFFAVADRVAQHFMSGELPLGHNPGGDLVYAFVKGAPSRFTEAERRSIYARAFGFAGSNDPSPNADFDPRWRKFLAAAVTPPGAPVMGDPAHDLAHNLSVHGGGSMHAAATSLEALVREVLAMLATPPVLTAYGVMDRWQLVERVSILYLGGAVNSVRQRTLAQRGAAIIQWLADHAQALASAGAKLDPRDDPALVAAAAAWLAAASPPP